MRIQMSLRKKFLQTLASASLMSLAAFSAAAGLEGALLVTDLTGTAMFVDPTQAPLSILSVIPSEARVRLFPAARLTVLVLQTGDEYVFTGPAVIRSGLQGLQLVEGIAPQVRPSHLAAAAKDLMIKPSGVSQATYVMRSASPAIRMLFPSGTRVLDGQMEFRWKPVAPGARYRFALSDETGATVYQSAGEDISVRLAPSVRLQEGRKYTWNVSTIVEGKPFTGSGTVSVASPGLKAQVSELRPAAAAALSERVTFAAWLQEMGLTDEARAYWRVLARERPEDPQLRILAAD